VIAGGLEGFHLALQHEVNAVGRIALMEKIIARRQILVNQTSHEPPASGRGKTFQKSI
jgi:hypothetical protein